MNLKTLIAFFCSLSLLGCTAEVHEEIGFAVDPSEIERGLVLTRGLAACGVCHGESADPDAPLIGGRAYVDHYGPVGASNITPAQSGIAGWRAGELVRVLRGGPRRDGERVASEVHRGYEWMSDADTLAVVSYLLTVPPVEKRVERRSLSFMERNTRGFFDVQREVTGFVPEIDGRFTVQYGKYLTDNVARCGFCHDRSAGLVGGGEYLGGGRTIAIGDRESLAPNITNSPDVGIGGWSQGEIVSYLKTGAKPGGDVTPAILCPTNFYRNAPESELTSIALYLKSLPD